jgi:hypothetical protein
MTILVDTREQTPLDIRAYPVEAATLRAGVHVVWCGGRDGAARTVESLVRQFVRGIEKDVKRLGARVAYPGARATA